MICSQWSTTAASNNSFLFYVTSGNKLSFSYGSGSTNAGVTSANSVPLNQWVRVEVVVVSGVAKLFIDGVLDANTLALVGAMNNSNRQLLVGAFEFGLGLDAKFNGYMDELRITKGVARHTVTYTPETAPFPDSA
jgi:hypothetical protein